MTCYQIYSFEWWVMTAVFPFLLCYFISSLPGMVLLIMRGMRP